MNESTFNKVVEIAAVVFKTSILQLDLNSSAETVDKWDSLSHAIFISELEDHFNIRFSLTELITLSTLSDIIESIEAKQNAN